MKRIFNLLFLSLAATACLAQDTDDAPPSVPFVAYWDLGDSYDFRITKIRRTSKEGEEATGDSTTYTARFTVIDSTADSYRVRWESKDYRLSNEIPEEFREVLKEGVLTEVIYRTSELGELEAIENWRAIAKEMERLTDALVARVAGNDREMKKTLEQSMAPFLAAYNSEVGVLEYGFKELRYFHFPFGVEIKMGEVWEYDDELPNMFGGDPIEAKGRIHLESVDHENFFCVQIQELDLDPESTRKMLFDVFRAMGLDGQELEEAMGTAVVSIKDRNRFEYWYDPGVPNLIEGRREAYLDIMGSKGHRVDLVRIELME